MKLLEIYTSLLESKATETQGLSMLRKAGIENGEAIVSDMASSDSSQNQKNIPIMCYIYINWDDNLKTVIDVVNEYDELEKLRKVKPIQLTNNGLVMGGDVYTDFIKFSEEIHGKINDVRRSGEIRASVDADFHSEKKPLWSGNGIDIYDGLGVGKCISYTTGGLTGRGYGFCIGQPGNTMYQSYRDSKTSTFYYIVDRNHFEKNDDGSVNLDDPLHMVVFDYTRDGIELTDANNTTGNIAEPYGRDAGKYVEYLKSNGVPVDKMLKHQPKTDDENKEQELLGRRNTDLDWFVKLPIDYKSKYIGRGHLLTNDQFDYLMRR
jgi:hypothetical protein